MNRKEFSEIIRDISITPLKMDVDGGIDDYPYDICPIKEIKPLEIHYGWIKLNFGDKNLKKIFCPTPELRQSLIDGCIERGEKYIMSEDLLYMVEIKGPFTKQGEMTAIEINNKELFELSCVQPGIEVVARYNQTLYDYTLDKVKLEKKSSSTGSWQDVMDKVVDWFNNPLCPDIDEFDSLFDTPAIGSTKDLHQNNDEKPSFESWQEFQFFRIGDVEYDLSSIQAMILEYVINKFGDQRTFSGSKVVKDLNLKGSDSLQPFFKENMEAFKVLFDLKNKQKGTYCLKLAIELKV